MQNRILHDVFIAIGGVILFCCIQALLYLLLFVVIGFDINSTDNRSAYSAACILALTNFVSLYYCRKIVIYFLKRPHFNILYSGIAFIITILFIWTVFSMTEHPISIGKFSLCLVIILYGFSLVVLPNSVFNALDKKNREKERRRRARHHFDEDKRQ